MILMAAAGVVSGQIRISGKVTDAEHHPLSGVNLAIRDSYDGTTSGTDGTYSFTTTEKGPQVLEASEAGYSTDTFPVNINSMPLSYNPVLVRSYGQLNLVTISAGSFEASDEHRGTVLKPLDIVTTAGANADVISALKTLPGAQQIGESSGLFVRGGTGEETPTFIDGMTVNDPYFSSVPDIAQRGRFSPFLFKGTVFSSGGYSAQYGQGLSGAVILESEDLPKQSSSTLAVSSVGLGLGTDQLSKSKTFSYGGDLNYTNLGPYYGLITQRQAFTTKPVFWNGDVNFRVMTSKTGMLKFYGYGNYSKLGFLQPSLNNPGQQDMFTLDNENVYTNLTYTDLLNEHWKIYLGASYSDNADKIGLGEQSGTGDTLLSLNHVNNRDGLAQGKIMMTRYVGRFSALRFGTEYHDAFNSFGYDQYDTNYVDHYLAAFAETDLYFTTKFMARIGVRTEYSSLLNKWNIAPRISLAYKVADKDQFSVAYGDFYERPDTLFWLNGYDKLGFVRATHYIASFQRVSHDYTFRVEAFYKKYSGLVTTVPDTTNGGSGYAKGIELFWRDRKTFKNIDYWISYSYLDTKRKWVNYPFAAQPNFAATNTLDIVFKKYFPAITSNLGLTYSFASGRPYYDPNLPAADFLSERTIPYNSLGISYDYLANIHGAFTVFVLSISNALNSSQVYGYNYSNDKTRRQAIVPPANRFFFVGMFMSFGVNRTQEVIDNN